MPHTTGNRRNSPQPWSRLTQVGLCAVVAACAFALTLLVSISSSSAQSTANSSALIQHDGPLKIRAPKVLVLGADASTTISFRGQGPALTLFASAGSVSDPVLRNGRLEATYTPPATRFPQVALVAAVTADRSVVDFVAIALYGKPTLRINSEPKALVHVKVEDTTFGPVKLNRKGKGSIEITVPPGIEAASIITADRLGNEKQQPRKLGVPPFQQLLAICPQGGNELLVVATDTRGNALKDAALQLSASIGTLDKPRELAPGVYSTVFSVDSSIAFAESVQLTAALPGAGETSTVTCSAEIPREVPTGLGITLGAMSFVAGSGAAVEVTIKLSYPGKRLPQQAVPTLVAELGTVSELEPVTQTQYRARWTLPNAFSDRSKAVLRAQVKRAGIDGAATLELTAGPVAQLSITSGRSRIRADREDSTVLSIEALDSFGNATPTGSLTISAVSGAVETLPGDGASTRARYRGPSRSESGRDTITVRSPSGQEATLSMLLDPRPSRFLVNARMGFTTNFGAVSTMAFAADASLRLDLGGHNVALGVEGGYFSHSETRDLDEGGESVDLQLSVAPVLARLVYELHDALPAQLYVGASGGVLFTTATIQSEATGMRTESSPNVMYSGLAGVRKRLGPGLLGIEAAYWYSRLNEEGISGSLGGLRITGGYGFDL